MSFCFAQKRWLKIHVAILSFCFKKDSLQTKIQEDLNLKNEGKSFAFDKISSMKISYCLFFFPCTVWPWISRWPGTWEPPLWEHCGTNTLTLTHSPVPVSKEYSEPSVASTLSRERGDISRILFSLSFKNQKNSIPTSIKEEEVFDLIGIVSTWTKLSPHLYFRASHNGWALAFCWGQLHIWSSLCSNVSWAGRGISVVILSCESFLSLRSKI